MNPIKMIAWSILVIAVVSGCGGASIEERNAAAKAAVPYNSGADFVKALEQAGVPCPNQEIGHNTVWTPGVGDWHLMDNVRCTYPDNTLHVYVALPDDEWSRKYFSNYIEALQDVLCPFGKTDLQLKGELWYADTSDNDQILFDIQEALGGQIFNRCPVQSK
jgi:hypothetical protein